MRTASTATANLRRGTGSSHIYRRRISDIGHMPYMHIADYLNELIQTAPNNRTRRYFRRHLNQGMCPYEVTQLSFLFHELREHKRTSVWRVLKFDNSEVCTNGCTSYCITCGHCSCSCFYCLKWRWRATDGDERLDIRRKHANNCAIAVEQAVRVLLQRMPVE